MRFYKKLFVSFFYAFKGIVYTIRNERNMRIHLVCMAYMYYFLFAFDFFAVTRTQLAVILLANGAVLAAELFNTAIERTVDTVTKDIVNTAGIAKDVAAGAVLITVLGAVAAGISILWQPDAFSALFKHYSENPISIALFILSIIVFSVFIFAFDFMDERKKK